MAVETHLFDTYVRTPLSFERGEGARLFDENGKDYLDCHCGIAVNALGHAHPRLVEALAEQAGKIWHLSNLFPIPGQERLASRLCELSFADKVFFSNSGAEAIECVIKTARRFHYGKGDGDRIDVIGFEGAFHGRTLAAINAAGQEAYLEGFGPRLPGFRQVGFGDLDALAAEMDEKTALVLIEPIQGESGIHPLPAGVLREIRSLCDERGVLLAYDEIQTGMGRTGRLFAHEWADGASPDLMALAKGLGGGFPIGACLATREAAEGMVVGTHGTTFGGNPLAMAVGNAVLDVMSEPGFLDHVREMGKLLGQHLAELADRFPERIESIRGQGLMMGIKARIPNGELIDSFAECGVLAAKAGDNVVRILPPLIVTAEELREVRSRMESALGERGEAK